MSSQFIRHSLTIPGIHFRVRLLYFVFLKRLKLFNGNEKLLLLAVREKVPRHWKNGKAEGPMPYSYSALKKKKKIFLIYKEIQKGSGAKSYMTKYLRISTYCIRKPFLINDFPPDPF